MSLYQTFYPVLVFLSAVIACGITVVAWRNRDISGARWLAVHTAGVAVWGIAKLLEMYSGGLSPTIFWVNVQYAGIVVVPVSWLAFAFQYTGRERWVNGWTLAVLLIVPVLVTVLLWTNELHGLFRTVEGIRRYGSLSVLRSTFEPAFWLHAGYSYLLLLAGSWLIVQLAVLSFPQYSGQAFGLLVVVVVPWIGNAINLLERTPPGLDPTIIAFTLSGVILLGLVARHRLLELVPAAKEVARDELIDTMSDAVLVVDGRRQVVDANPAARSLIGATEGGVIGRPLADVCPPLADVVETPIADETETVRTELSLVDDDRNRYFDVRVKMLTRSYGLVTGKLISLRDITEQRQHEQRLNVLNRLLRHNLRTELNVVKGHTSLLADELTASSLREHTDRIDTAVTSIIEQSDKFARAVNQLDADSSGPIDLAAEIASIVETTRQAHPDVQLSLTSPPAAAWTTAGPFVTTAVEELVTNAIEHADRPDLEISITVTVDEVDGRDVIRVQVADNGPGIPEAELEPIVRGGETQLTHSTGVGLWLVTWIVEEAGGSIDITSGDDGTTVAVTLPRADPREHDVPTGE